MRLVLLKISSIVLLHGEQLVLNSVLLSVTTKLWDIFKAASSKISMLILLFRKIKTAGYNQCWLASLEKVKTILKQ